MLSCAMNLVNRNQLLVKVDHLDSIAQFRSVHVCDDVLLIDGEAEAVERFRRSASCLQSLDCRYPQSPWRREYRYLGDVSVNTPFRFDLRLTRELSTEYSLQADLPEGVHFEKGILSGLVLEATPILDLRLTASEAQRKISTRYQIRFYEGQNRALSYTDGHYLRYGYGEDLVDYDPSKTYFRLFESSGSELQSPFTEAQRAARRIETQAQGQPIVLFVSGGIDSQSMVQAFVAAGVRFQAVLMVDAHGCNADDVFYARRFFHHLQKPLTEFTLDFAAFIRSYQYVEMANRYRFNNPEYGILLHMMDRFPGFPVYAGRPISISHARTGEPVVGLAVDETWSRSRYMERNRHQGCPEFLIHTPELMESFLQVPMAKSFPRGQEWIYPRKIDLLREGGFNVEWAPPVKLTGFENLEHQFANSEMGNELWLHHRGPLKLRYPNGAFRNAIPIVNGRIGSSQPVLLKTYEDGFSFKYLMTNKIQDFH